MFAKLKRHCVKTCLVLVCTQLLLGLILLERIKTKVSDNIYTNNIFSSIKINHETSLYTKKTGNDISHLAHNMLKHGLEHRNYSVIKREGKDRDKIENKIDEQNDNRQKNGEKNVLNSLNLAKNLDDGSYKSTRHMLDLHFRVWNYTTLEEVKEFYKRDRELEALLENPLDVYKDRKILKRLFPSPHEEYDRVIPQMKVKLQNTTTKTILLWNTDGNAQTKFKEDDCSIKDCVLTFDKSKSEIADAVLFREMIPADFKRSKSNKHQVTVVSQLESAQNRFALTYGVKVNWTFTYRRDSVMNAPYERYTAYPEYTTLPDKAKRNFAAGKSKMAAWFVSNCGAVNNRNGYAKELQKYIEVDIYGSCGPLSCFRANKECFIKLKRDYKFYLSFENSNCKDYITEKLFWNGHQNDIIPIVMGAHPDEYKRIAPPRSYIHVDMFESPKELADYLIFLDKHDDFYNSYFLWKDTGRFLNTKSLCRLCSLTHLAPHFPMWYSDVNKWWTSHDTCTLPVGFNSWKGKSPVQNNHKYVKYGYERT